MKSATRRVAHRLVRTTWTHWAQASNERAVANARAAAVECSRRLLERLEVELAVERIRQDVDHSAPAARAAH